MKKCKNYLLALMLSFYFILTSCGEETITTNNNNNNNNNLDTVKIGNQVWMKKNLDVDHYRNGDPIPQVNDALEWSKLTTGAWCYYNNDTSYGKTYGKLYNWFAVNDPRGLAPDGWRIPSVDDWTILINYLGGDEIAGGKLKQTGTDFWQVPNTGATNESGFIGLPSGFRRENGLFYNLGYSCNWWTTNDMGGEYAFNIFIDKLTAKTQKNADDVRFGFAIRCIRE